ncbi:MAG TPA: hypothetical protein VEI96_09795 [Thermodesulfovibrionales bacterium]|nr:hypothetical protein [Thermodesulfovibrionales bacterium]
MTLGRIAEILDAEFLVNAGDPNTEIESVCSSDLMSDLLHFSARPKSLLITGLINNQVVRTAEIADINAVVFVLNKRPDRETVSLAEEKGIWLLVTRLSRYTACGRLYGEGLRSCTEEDGCD